MPSVSLTYGAKGGKEAAFWRALRNLLEHKLNVVVTVEAGNAAYVRDSIVRIVKRKKASCLVQLVLPSTIQVAFP